MSAHDRNEDAYDAIVIGAGISGLVCGCYLAKAGLKILLVEQHDKPGGYFTSFKHRGFLFDSAAHSFGNFREGGHVRKIFTDLGVEEKIAIDRYDPSDIIVTPGHTVTFWGNPRKTLDGIGRQFPSEKSNFRRFHDFLTASRQSEFAKLKNKTFQELLDAFFTDKKLKSILAVPVFGNGGLPPSRMHAFSAAKIFSEFVIDGGYYPRGGMQNLPDALAEIIHQHGGTLAYNRLVKKILVENKTATGIVLDDNTVRKSKYVISAADLTATFNSLLLDYPDWREFAPSLELLTPSPSNVILYIGLKNVFPELPAAGTNTWNLPHYDLDAMFTQTQRCNFGESGMFMLRVAPDQRTVLVFVGAPFRTAEFWKQNKKQIADDFLERVIAFLPALKNHIACVDAATPHTLYRYTLNHHGASFGWNKTPSQTYDPAFTRTTRISGLYLTGHWTSIAFGMPGTCYGGHDTARRILRKERLL